MPQLNAEWEFSVNWFYADQSFPLVPKQKLGMGLDALFGYIP